MSEPDESSVVRQDKQAQNLGEMYSSVNSECLSIGSVSEERERREDTEASALSEAESVISMY